MPDHLFYKKIRGRGDFLSALIDEIGAEIFSTDLPIGGFSLEIKSAPFFSEKGIFFSVSGGSPTTRIIFPKISPAIPTKRAGESDGDGDLDIALSMVYGLYVLLNDGFGPFQVLGGVIPGDDPINFSVRWDFDDDGFLDAFSRDARSGGIAVYFGDGTGQFPSSWRSSGYFVQQPKAVGDFDGDADLDLALMIYEPEENSGALYLSRYIGENTFSPPERLGDHYVLDAADFDNDSDVDLLASHGGLRLLLNDGDASFSVAPLPGDLRSHPIRILDIDGDSDLDLVGRGSNQPEAPLLILLNNGDASFSPPINTGIPFGDSFGDFDGDSDLDVITLGSSPGGSVVRVYLYESGSFGSPTFYDPGIGSVQEPQVGYFNGDAALDFLVRHDLGMSAFLNEGDGQFSAPVLLPEGTRGSAFLDLNGDSISDFVDAFQGQFGVINVSVILSDP